MKRPLLIFLFSLFATLPGLAQTAAPTPQSEAASNASEERTVGALLFEVRLLRIALQTVNTNSKRIQLLAERIRIQQDRTDKVAAEIEVTREKSTDVRTQLVKLEEVSKEFDIQMRQEPIALRRVELERQKRLALLDVPALRERESRLKEREALLLNQQAAEAAKLYELQEKMNELEREFEADAAAERKVNAASKKK
jgi:hypothetical protein